MRATECPREQDMLDALCAGRWPVRCDDDLRTHVAGCPVCADLVDVAGPLLQERERLWSEIRVPSAGTVWWRAQLRARREAARVAARPLAVAHLATCVAVIGLAIALTAFVAAAAGEWLPGTGDLPSLQLPAVTLPDIPRSDLLWRILAVAAAAWLALTPLALYLALREE